MLHSPTCSSLKYSRKQSAHVSGFLWIDTLFTQQKMSEKNWVWALCLHKEKGDITAIMYPWAIILGIFYIICIILCISCLVWVADLIKKKKQTEIWTRSSFLNLDQPFLLAWFIFTFPSIFSHKVVFLCHSQSPANFI